MKDSVKSSIKGFDGFESVSQQEQVSNPRPSSVHFGTTGLAFALLDNLNSGPNRSNSAPSMRPAHRGLPPVVISTLHLHHLVKHGQWWGNECSKTFPFSVQLGKIPANRKLLDPLCPCLLDPLWSSLLGGERKPCSQDGSTGSHWAPLPPCHCRAQRPARPAGSRWTIRPGQSQQISGTHGNQTWFWCLNHFEHHFEPLSEPSEPLFETLFFTLFLEKIRDSAKSIQLQCSKSRK